jgi:hypothetical protein
MGRKVWGFTIAAPLFDQDPGGPPAPPAPPPAETVSMTKAELEAMIEGRVGAAVKAAKKNADPGISAEERKELDRLKKADEDRAREALAAKGNYDAALKSQEESIRKEYEPKLAKASETASQLQKRLEDKVIGQTVAEAAGSFNAVNPAQVRQLLASEFKMDDEFNATVVDDKGQQRFVAGKPMTPEQRVKEFLDQNPHLVRSTAGAGGGAGGGRTMTTGDASLIKQAEDKVKAAYDIALQSGTPVALAAHAKAQRELDALKAGKPAA